MQSPNRLMTLASSWSTVGRWNASAETRWLDGRETVPHAGQCCFPRREWL